MLLDRFCQLAWNDLRDCQLEKLSASKVFLPSSFKDFQRRKLNFIPMIKFARIPLFCLLSILSIAWKFSYSWIINPSKVKIISWQPRAFVYEGFLMDEQCNYLISLVRPELKTSAMADRESGKSTLSKDPIIAGREDNIATRTFLPKEIQVQRYEAGQKYDPRYDYFMGEVNMARGGNRIATVLMYLTDVEKGGETVFPSAEELPHRRSVSTDKDFCECRRQGPAVKPSKGDALLFFSLHPDAVPDPSRQRAGCLVDEDVKWSATKWIHVDSFEEIVGADGNCMDANENCERWASLAECT